MQVYETIFDQCNRVPWHIIPADRNWVKINTVSKILLKALEDLDLKCPELSSEKFASKK